MIEATMIMPRKNNLKNMLDSRKWTIYRLAKLTGIPHHNVSKIVKADQIPERTEYKTLLALSEALGVSIDDLEDKED